MLKHTITRIAATLAALSAITISYSSYGDDMAPRKLELRFEKGAVIEVAYASVKEGMQPQLQEYFGKVFPIGPDYGAKPLGVFPVLGYDSKGKSLSNRPALVGLFQWPDIEGYLRFHEDERFLAAVPGRDEALSYLNNGNFYVVQEDTTLTVHEDRFYEIFNGTLNSNKMNAQSKLRKDQRDVGKFEAVSLKLYPLSSVTRTAVEHSCEIGSDHDFNPETITISEWPSMEAATSSSGERKKAYKSFTSAVGPYSFPAAQH